MSIDERKEKYGDDKRVVEHRIRTQVKEAVNDLALIACGLGEKENHEIFRVEDVCHLLECILDKIGDETTDKGPYYQVLVHEIVSTMNKKMSIKKVELNYILHQRIIPPK